jgi:hypothetical protein
LSVNPKRGKAMNLYTKERKKIYMPTARAGAGIRASVPKLGLQLSMGAGKADGGRRGWWGQTRLVGAGKVNGGGKPLASCPSPPASKTKEATGPNP